MSPPRKAFIGFSNAKIVQLYLEPLNSSVNYPLLLVYKVNYHHHIFSQKKNFSRSHINFFFE